MNQLLIIPICSAVGASLFLDNTVSYSYSNIFSINVQFALSHV